MQGNVNIPDSTITTNLSFRQLVLMNMQQLTNFPYIEKDFDALTDYELLSLVVKYLNDVIANQNEQNDSITRMYESFLALQTYVNNTKDTLEDAFNELDDYVRNYFDNLDVQDEINNKLDQMLEDGVLEQIIEQFLQSTAIWCFNTVADMKAATNLIDGSDARTLGYYSPNDGGGALYHITDTESLTEYQEELNSSLYATLIYNDIIPEQLGAYGDNTHDDTAIIKKCIDLLDTKGGGTIKFINNYKIESEIDISGYSNIILDGNGKGKLTKPINNNTNIFFGDGCSNIKFYNLLMEGNRPETLSYTWPHTMNAAIICRESNNITVENCTFNNFWYGVCTSTSGQSYNSIINNCKFNNCNSDIDLYGKPLISITNISSNGCTDQSIQIEPSSASATETTFDYLEETNINSMSVNNIISGCSITNCNGTAINIHSGSIDVIISNNTITNCKRGIMCHHIDSKNIVISNNTILNMTQERADDNARALYFEGCGIALARNIYGAIVSNNIVNHARCGIFIGGTSAAQYASNYLIQGNSVQYCKTSGISLTYAKYCQVSNNYLYNNAIGLSNGTTYYKNSGILLDNCTQINCSSNYCNDTSNLETRQRACVYIDSTSDDITVSNCTGINMVENPVNNDARTGGRYADGTNVYTSPFTAITNA